MYSGFVNVASMAGFQIWYIVSFLPKISGRNQDFTKGSVWGGSHFSKCLGRKGFGEEFQFSDFCLWGSLIFDNLQCL